MRIINQTPSDGVEPAPASLIVQDAGSIFCAVGYDGTAQSGSGAAARLLASATSLVLASGVEPAAWPRSVAAHIATRLGAQAPGDPPWIVFAAALVTEQAVHVCTAGDIRVQMERDGAVLRATRDHVLANEPADWVRATYGDMSVEHHGGVITRSLGGGSRPPEHEVWPAAAPFVVLVGASARIEV